MHDLSVSLDRAPILPVSIVHAQAPQGLLAHCLGRLLALISHELSNPLQSLTMLVELALVEADEPERLQHRLGQGLQAANELRQVVRDLTDYASGSLTEGPQTCAQIVGRALALVRRRLNRHDVRVSAAYGPLEYIAVPGALHALAVLHTLLAVVQSLASSRLTAFELVLQGRLGDVPDDPKETRAAVLEVQLKGHAGTSSWVNQPISVEPLVLGTGEELVSALDVDPKQGCLRVQIHFFAPPLLG
jgi:signal transduction histidine kinase